MCCALIIDGGRCCSDSNGGHISLHSVWAWAFGLFAFGGKFSEIEAVHDDRDRKEPGVIRQS